MAGRMNSKQRLKAFIALFSIAAVPLLFSSAFAGPYAATLPEKQQEQTHSPTLMEESAAGAPPGSDFSAIDNLLDDLDAAVPGGNLPEKQSVQPFVLLTPPMAAVAPAANAAPVAEKQQQPAAEKKTQKDKTAAAAQPESKTAAQPSAPAATAKQQSSIVLPPEQPVPVPGPAQEKEEQKVKLTGYRYLKFRNFKSNGSNGQFMSREGLTSNAAKIEQGTNLSLSAKIGDRLKLDGTFNEMPNQDREMVFSLTAGHYISTYGDFAAQLAGGQFGSFSKSITGMQFEYKTKRTTATAIISQSKSQTKTIQFTGRNIRGPYDLNATDIMPDEATVKVNNIVLSSSEYIIDAFQGEITFIEILGQNDTATITYEQNLEGGLNAGDLTGMAFEQKTKNGRLTYGAAHLQQAANTQAQRLMETGDETVTGTQILASDNHRTISVSHGFIVHTDAVVGTETITRTDAVTGDETVLEPGNDYNWMGEFQSYQVEGFYALGRFVLKAPPDDPNDTYEITYSYYPESSVIQQQTDEELLLDNTGTVGYPQHQTIYSGSETISVCLIDTPSSCDPALQPGIDYLVDERLKQINFLIAPSLPITEFIKISYWYYPNIDQLQSKYDHTVDDYRLKYDMSDSLQFEYETATSESDVSSRSIPVINYIVSAASGTDLDCTVPEHTKDCTFSLGHTDILSGSVVIYFNDRVSEEGVQTYSTDYMLDLDRGEVLMKEPIPAGTVLIADYQYRPQLGGGLKTGSRSNFKASYNGSKTQADFSLTTGDTFFSQIGGESNLETENLSYGFSHSFSDSLKFTTNWLTTKSALDILETHNSTSNASKFAIQYSSDLIKSLSIGYDTRQSTDDYAPAQTDSDENKLSLNLAMPLTFLKNADFRFGYAKTDNSNNAESAGSETTTNARTFGLDYNPTRKLMLTSIFTVNTVDSTSDTTSFSSTNQSRQIGLKWIPIPLLMISIGLDSQNTSDSRASVSDRSIQSTRISVSTQPFGKFKSVQLSMTQQDSPSVGGTSSGTKSTMLSTGYLLSSALTFSPSWSVSQTYVGDNSTTKNTSSKYGLDYRPPGRPYHVTFDLQDSVTDNTTKSSQTSSTNGSWDIIVGYDPNPRWSYSITFQNDSTASSSSSGYDSKTFKTRINHKLNEKTRAWLSLQNLARSGSYNEASRSLELGSDTTVTEILSLNLLYRLSSYNNSNESSDSYTGNYFEGTLKATF
jgi:hypothetical protein